MRRPDGVTIIAVYQFVVAALFLVGACVILAIPIPVVLFEVRDATGLFWSLFGLGLGLLASVAVGGVYLVAAWGLLKLKNWARWLTAGLSILSLLAFPIGTIIGGVIIWYLLTEPVKQIFEPAIESPMS